jgi:NADP-dependent 3-hydroxy acid dehydrogenase YdfG
VRIWLVTGSSRGLGRAIVEAGLAAGNKVLATARDIKSLADLLERYGDQVQLFAMNVTDEAAAANAVMAAVDVFGSLVSLAPRETTGRRELHLAKGL